MNKNIWEKINRTFRNENIIAEIKNSLEYLKSRLEWAEENISELGARAE